MANSGCPREVAEGSLARCGLALAQWSERWFPDPLVFAFMGIVFVFLTGIALGEGATTKASIPPALFETSGLIPLTQTLFLWQSIVTAVVLIGVSVGVAYFSAPSAENAKTADDLGVSYRPIDTALSPWPNPESGSSTARCSPSWWFCS